MEYKENQGPAVWGGIEYTINRVGDQLYDQLDYAGLYKNDAYLDAVIDLGITTMRFPVLWEKQQLQLDKAIDWSWATQGLNKLRWNDIRPVIGLLHHGSGPAFTNLLEEDFPVLFAAYAAQVAKQFPWVEMYTPVNEPLTTARFSGLYGIWYPHKQNDVSFINMLLNELMATVLAMKEIRKVNPNAQLVQTEDLGKTYSTPLLAYQSNFENHRRWLTYDILCGLFNHTHPLWNHVLRLGINLDKLQFFIDNPCPPNLVGVNHYVTSERYLDEHIEHYSSDTIGGNGLHRYADVEAVRVNIEQPTGLGALLRETWERYKIPIVITEAHLNCTREEQVRWLHYVYETALNCNNEGIEVQAVTIWSLLGSYGWNKLLSGESFDYETGAFDLSEGYARPTAIAAYVRALTGKQTNNFQILGHGGWWQAASRFIKKEDIHHHGMQPGIDSPVLIVGKSGTLLKMLATNCTRRHIEHTLVEMSDYDQMAMENLWQQTESTQPWAVIYIETIIPERETGSSHFSAQLESLCRQRNIKLMSLCLDPLITPNAADNNTFSGENAQRVLHGSSSQPGRSAYDGTNNEQPLQLDPLVIKTADNVSTGNKNQVKCIAVHKKEMNCIMPLLDNDVAATPYLQQLVNVSLDLLIDNAVGNWHLVPRVASGPCDLSMEQGHEANTILQGIAAGIVFGSTKSIP